MIVSQPTLGAVVQLGGWALGRRTRFKVSGPSMEPTLADGEFVLVDPHRRPRLGELALARHPNQPGLRVVKRVAAIESDGRYVLASDHPDEGTDSRQWGPVASAAIEGRVTLVLDRPLASLARPGPVTPATTRSLARWLRR